MHHACSGVLGGQKMWSDSLELELQAVGSYLVWVLEPNLCPLQEQHMLLTAKQSLSSMFHF